VPLLRRARAEWIALSERTGEPLYRECGVLYLGPSSSDVVERTRSAAESHGVRHTRLGVEGVRERYPQFTLPADYQGLLEPEAGWVAAEAGVSALAREALVAGAELRAGEAVRSWREGARGVVVHTSQGEYSASSLVVASGAWTPRLLAVLGVKLRVTRQVLLWVWPREPALFGEDRFPVWAMQTPHGFAYGFPFAPGRVGLKLALHEAGPETDPDQVSRELGPADRELVQRILAGFIPQAAGPVVGHGVCLYTNSPDGHFIIDRLPGSERVVVGAGFSGHGFKFAPVVGEALADLALEGRTALPIGFLGLHRFRAREGQ